jgi:PKD repeat protein
MPQGGGVFSPTHPIPASGGTARIVYTMVVSEGTGSDYSLGHDAWAGWLTTTPTGTAVFGYQQIAGTLSADFTAEPRRGFAPLTVQFTDLSVGDVLTRAWDFGDGGTALLPGTALPLGPAHTYTVSGCYTVTLTVEDAYGSDALVRPGYIRVTDVTCTVFLPVVLRDYAS